MSYRNVRLSRHTDKHQPGFFPSDTMGTSLTSVPLWDCISQYYYDGSCSIREAVSLHFRGANGRERRGAAAQRAPQTLNISEGLCTSALPRARPFECTALHPRARNLVKQQTMLHALLLGPRDKQHKVGLDTLPPLLRPPPSCQHTACVGRCICGAPLWSPGCTASTQSS